MNMRLRNKQNPEVGLYENADMTYQNLMYSQQNLVSFDKLTGERKTFEV